MTNLDEIRVRSLLAELGERLSGRGIDAEIYVVGGGNAGQRVGVRPLCAVPEPGVP